MSERDEYIKKCFKKLIKFQAIYKFRIKLSLL